MDAWITGTGKSSKYENAEMAHEEFLESTNYQLIMPIYYI